ncbi:BURP domain-containing protein BNM2A-like [Humulus lupulus]|uniref:BURP domain-containing protein BNM2A-like n=1 Tax=Humulus lupulus TaxID=3486 RepID=UPI002B414741|nr:BURP domain-containing protein BNM2A-like [Humulus lupulus]
MGLGSWCVFLVLLYFSWSSECHQETNGDQYSSDIRLPSASKEDHDDGHMHMHNVDDHGPSSSSHTHLDRSTLQQSVFLNINDIKVGLTKPIYFPKKKKASPPFLGRQILGDPNSIPFSSEQLPNFLSLFSVPQGSPQAKAMESTLHICESNPIKGETKMCATSFDSMLEFVRGMFGLDGLGHGFTHLTTTFYNDSNTMYQNYTVLEDLREIPTPKMVACHLMEFPYAVYTCHSMAKDRKLFKMSLSGQMGDTVETIVVCHMDTSEWNSDHISFKALGFGPGMGPVCHFFPDQNNFVWLPSSIPI